MRILLISCGTWLIQKIKDYLNQLMFNERGSIDSIFTNPGGGENPVCKFNTGCPQKNWDLYSGVILRG